MLVALVALLNELEVATLEEGEEGFIEVGNPKDQLKEDATQRDIQGFGLSIQQLSSAQLDQKGARFGCFEHIHSKWRQYLSFDILQDLLEFDVLHERRVFLRYHSVHAVEQPLQLLLQGFVISLHTGYLSKQAEDGLS